MAAKNAEFLTVREAIVNLCNTCIGIGIFAKPFALAVSGWYGIVSFVVAAVVIIYVGICFSDASRELLMNKNNDLKSHAILINVNDNDNDNDNDKNKSEYQLISGKSMGNCGEIYSIISFMILFAILLAIIVIMIYELIVNIKDKCDDSNDIDSKIIFLFSLIIYIPTALILNWKQMTFVAYIGVISVVAIIITLIGILIYAFYKFDYAPPPNYVLIKHINDINSSNLAINAQKNMSIYEELTFSFVIFVTGVSGNAVIPKLSTSLKNKNDIIFVVIISYVIVSIFYCVTAVIGFWLYGGYTDVMLLNSFSAWPGGYVVVSLEILVILNLLSSFAIMLSLLGDMFEGLLNIEIENNIYRRLSRTILLLIIFTFSYFLRNNLAFLVALCGAIGALGSVALTMPFIMYICTFWNHKTKPLSTISKVFNLILAIIFIAIGVYVCYGDIVNVY